MIASEDMASIRAPNKCKVTHKKGEMEDQGRLEAGKHQALRFLSTQYSKWRLAAIMSIKKILEEKEAFYADMKDELRQPDDQDGLATIHQEISNGLIFLALSENLQYIEELFLMIKYSKDIAWFIKNIITYQAGKITNYIESFPVGKKEIAESFLLPYFSESYEWEDEKIKLTYIEALDRLADYVGKVRKYFADNVFFYNQYKHGLTVALRPFGKFSEDLIQKSKEHPQKGNLVAYDNLSIDKVFRESARFKSLIMIPDIGVKGIKENLVSLQKEDNLLRMVPQSTREANIDDILEVAHIVYTLYEIIRFNMCATCQELKDGLIDLYLPGEKVSNWVKISFPTSNL